MTEPILRAEGLTKHYEETAGVLESLLGRGRRIRAVDGVDLALHRGETLGIVGESGCGKTTLARTLLLLTEPTAGSVHYRRPAERTTAAGPREIDLTDASARQRRRLRADLQYVFQDPFESLNPRQTAGEIIAEPLAIHDIASGSERDDRVIELLRRVGLRPAHAGRYPHEFSGGQRQRIGIARALAVEPAVLVCDEPVSTLDVSVQAQILNLLTDIQEDLGLSMLFIAHDLSVVEHVADRIGVMYLGELVEVGPTASVFEPPHHPYTEALLAAIPEPDPSWSGDRPLISGHVPSPADPPPGCRFHTRCPRVIQPDDVALPAEEWRPLFRFAGRVREAESAASLVGPDREGAAADPTAMERGRLAAALRDRHDLPADPSDRTVADALERAIDAIGRGDLTAASAQLEPVTSPCARVAPGEYDVGPDHAISCLLYDEAIDHEGPPAMED